MEPKTEEQIHIVMGNGYPKDGSIRPMLGFDKGHRIVSKGAYAKAQTNRATISLFGIGSWLVAVFFALLAVGLCLAFLVLMCSSTSIGENLPGGIVCLLLSAVIGGVAYLFSMGGKTLMQEAANIDPGVPLTRANTADLPAPDSLVRASTEPLQAQQAVLLRAAEEVERPPEEMLRASVSFCASWSGRPGQE